MKKNVRLYMSNLKRNQKSYTFFLQILYAKKYKHFRVFLYIDWKVNLHYMLIHPRHFLIYSCKMDLQLQRYIKKQNWRTLFYYTSNQRLQLFIHRAKLWFFDSKREWHFEKIWVLSQNEGHCSFEYECNVHYVYMCFTTLQIEDYNSLYDGKTFVFLEK